MAKLVRPVCATCGKPIKPKNKTGKIYVHGDYTPAPYDPTKSWKEIAAERATRVEDHPIVIKMVTLKERY